MRLRMLKGGRTRAKSFPVPFVRNHPRCCVYAPRASRVSAISIPSRININIIERRDAELVDFHHFIFSLRFVGRAYVTPRRGVTFYYK